MFEIEQKVMLVSVNARAEIHGDERKAAFDLKFSADCNNEKLIEFHPRLRQMIFKEATNPDFIEQQEEDGALTELVFPQMGAIKWDYTGTGYHLTVGYGVGGKSDIKLMDCKVDKFKFTPYGGGSVGIEFRVIVHPEVKDVGKLCDMIQQEIEIKLVPPAPENVHELFGEQVSA